MQASHFILPEWLKELKTSPIQSNQTTDFQQTVTSFALGLPNTALFPAEKLQQATQKLFQQGNLIWQYSAPQKELKMKIANLMRLRNIDCNENQIVLTHGAQQGISLMATLLLGDNRHIFLDEILYPNVFATMKAFSPTIWSIASHPETGIDIAQMAALLKQGIRPAFIYVITDGHNPLGCSLPLEKRLALCELSIKYHVPIIEDDAYGLLHHEPFALNPLKHYAPEQIFYLGSFSKILSPALRIGWMIVPESCTTLLENIKEGIDLNVANLSQRILNELLIDNFMENHLQHINQAYKNKKQLTLQAILKYFPDTTKVSSPHHGFFLWVELPKEVNTEILLDICIRELNITFITGNSFAYQSDPKWNSSMRISFSALADDEIDRALAKMGTAIRSLMQ